MLFMQKMQEFFLTVSECLNIFTTTQPAMPQTCWCKLCILQASCKFLKVSNICRLTASCWKLMDTKIMTVNFDQACWQLVADLLCRDSCQETQITLQTDKNNIFIWNHFSASIFNVISWIILICWSWVTWWDKCKYQVIFVLLLC